MKLQNSFEVQEPASRVWEMFQDVPQMSACLPGAELTEDRGDGTYTGAVEVKLGPITSSFTGEATVTSDRKSWSGAVLGKGVDRKGGSRGQLTVSYQL